MQHNERIQKSFTAQGTSFATQPWTADEERIARLVAAANLTGSERVLDIATGPGLIAEAFAREAQEVIGVDLTPAMLAIAEARCREHNVTNIAFRTGDVQKLEFGDGEFDVVVCRFAFHHFEEPGRVLSEMVRVCRKNGTVVVEDMIGSEHLERLTYQDRFEKLRDPSHTNTLSLSALFELFRKTGLEAETVTMGNDLHPELERWMMTTKTPPESAARIRRLLKDDAERDLSGVRPFQDAMGKLFFHERTAIVTGRKFR
jgi:2-polyprenyl-3-methyl-5-hydroxy-6-metoxy-1,4-benzoquinol methylase